METLVVGAGLGAAAAVGHVAPTTPVVAGVILEEPPTAGAVAQAGAVVGSGHVGGVLHDRGEGGAMLVAGVVITPLGMMDAAPAFTSLTAVLAGIGVGISSSVIPYVLDQLAMTRLPRATYALFVALLPATAVVIGLAVLHQVPRPIELVGVGLVMVGVLVHAEPRSRAESRPGWPKDGALLAADSVVVSVQVGAVSGFTPADRVRAGGTHRRAVLVVDIGLPNYRLRRRWRSGRRVPDAQQPGRLRSNDSVGRQAVNGLEEAHLAIGLRTEHPVDCDIAGRRDLIEPELQTAHCLTFVAEPQGDPDLTAG